MKRAPHDPTILPVFYRPEMVSRTVSFSPSAEKPRRVVDDWRELGLPIRLVAPDPVAEVDLALAHDRDFVRGVLAGTRANGFGTTSLEVAGSLPFTSGSMLAAARGALESGGICCSPSSGFHHAGWARASGFCTFNGLAVTALALHRDGLASRVAILDCDQHYGDGTDDILDRTGARSFVHHFTAGADFHDPRQVPDFFERLARELEAASECDVVLYQAGADPHVDDPLGGWLTTDELRRRDALVFDTLVARGVPVAWNLAGGYQRRPDGSIPDVLAIHSNTAREAIRALAEVR
jgi:acetoin utilization deacetylase AcuC-like enzyme